MKKNLVLDSKTFIKIVNLEMELSEILKVVNLLVKDIEVEKILITDEMLEKLNYTRKNNIISQKLYKNIEKLLNEGKMCQYLDEDTSTEDALIEYIIKKDEIFMSFDIRLNLKYRSRKIDEEIYRIDEKEFKKLVKLQKDIKKVDEADIDEYIKKMLEYNIVTAVEYIQLSPKERYTKVLDFVIEDKMKEEKIEIVSKIKEAVLRIKKGEILDKELKRNLSKLKGYNFGNLNFEESLEEIHAEIIEKFLKEKNIESLEELVKKNIFETKETVIEKIRKYYENKKLDNNLEEVE